jgi:hypothetical protein
MFTRGPTTIDCGTYLIFNLETTFKYSQGHDAINDSNQADLNASGCPAEGALIECTTATQANANYNPIRFYIKAQNGYGYLCKKSGFGWTAGESFKAFAIIPLVFNSA